MRGPMEPPTRMATDPPPDLATQSWAEQTLAGRPRPAGLDHAAWQLCASHGVFATLDTGALHAAGVFEALGKGGADRGLLFALGAHLFGVMASFVRHATAAQRARWECGLRDGRCIAALAVSETASGSSFDQLATIVGAQGDGLVLSGTKALITNAPDAHLFLVLARQFPEHGPLGLTMLLVPRDSPGLTVTRLPTGGLPGAPMGEVTFDACPLPAIATLGRAGAGLRVFASAMAWERSLLLAGFLGAAERNLRAAIRALAERDALRHQAVAHRIAAMHMRLATARHFVHTAAAALDAGREDAATAAMAKLAASEAVIACATDTARLLAGVGWRGVPFDTAAAIADTLGTLFASGTSEIQLDTIARHVIASARR